jgi:hypothetical protein
MKFLKLPLLLTVAGVSTMRLTARQVGIGK